MEAEAMNWFAVGLLAGILLHASVSGLCWRTLGRRRPREGEERPPSDRGGPRG